MSGADTEHGIETFLNTENRLAVNVSEAVFHSLLTSLFSLR